MEALSCAYRDLDNMVESGKIHRAELEEASEFVVKKQDRCMVELKTPSKFRSSVKKAMPTRKEACEFEKMGAMSGNNQCYDEANGRNWKYLGAGIHRCAMKFKAGGIVKFAFNSDYAIAANKYEVATYALADEGVKKYFMPVIAHSPNYWWIVVPEARTSRNDSLDYDRLKRIGDNLERKLESMGASCTDLHEGNVGLLGNKQVIIDYGFGVVCKRKEFHKKERRKERRLSEFPMQHTPSPFQQAMARAESRASGSAVPDLTRTQVSKAISENADNFKRLRFASQERIREDVIKAHRFARQLMAERRFSEANREVARARKLIDNAW